MIVIEKFRRDPTFGPDPEVSLDPHKLYEEQRIKAKANQAGVGRLVFELIPFSFIRSFALAIDPMKKFRAAPVKITPVNRTRKREVQSVLDERKYKLIRDRIAWQSFIWSTMGGPSGLFCYSPPVRNPSSGTSVIETATFTKQPASITTTKDTTSRTRPYGSDFGEFEHFDYTIESPVLNWSWYEKIHVSNTMDCNSELTEYNDYYRTQNSGPAGFMSKSSLDALQTSEKAELETIMQQKALGLISRTVPMSRRYSAFRNVAELKDLPKSILSLKRTIENFNRQIGILSPKDHANLRKYLNQRGSRDIPGEYVSYHFGWRQIYNDVMDLLAKPIRATNEVNRLMRRSGQPTTFRTISKFAGKTTNTPAFEYYFRIETGYGGTYATEHRRRHELRCVVNATFDFPKLNVPKFKQQLFLHKLGVNPMPTDLYNLVPWSWLLDWFTGLGNYVEAIDIINTDRSLINWGLLTGITKGEITTLRSFKTSSFDDRQVNGVRLKTTAKQPYNHTSKLLYTYQLRKNVTSAYDVKTILEPSSLSLYQQSILSAILMSRRGR
jgi:hypothetical protein